MICETAARFCRSVH
uniref:Uncharacterized protein n=1 Tax=Arundo donax TaxID=35708 RepID=A0A0A8ZU25_ARUDO